MKSNRFGGSSSSSSAMPNDMRNEGSARKTEQNAAGPRGPLKLLIGRKKVACSFSELTEHYLPLGREHSVASAEHQYDHSRA
jgi:hypothetical protein